MGYDAFVICNCFKEGKTAEPPYKDFMKVDHEGMYLDLETLYEQDKDEYFKRHQEFDEWKRSACPHEDMELVSERLANTSGMAAFKTILHEFGGEMRFPILTKYLPVANGGTLPTDYAEQALRELQDLEQEKPSEEKVVLKVKATGERKQSTNENHSNIFVWTAYNKQNYGIDKDGFFIIENRKFLWTKKSKLVFRSTEFKQVAISKDKYRFIDNLTNKQFIGTTKIHPDGQEEPKDDFEFVVEKEIVPLATEYNYIIEPLKKLAIASIETRNPIIWT